MPLTQGSRLGPSVAFGGPDLIDFFGSVGPGAGASFGLLGRPTIHPAPEQAFAYSGSAATSHSIVLPNTPAAGSLVVLCLNYLSNQFANITLTAPTHDTVEVGHRAKGAPFTGIMYAAIADGTTDFKTWTVTGLSGTAQAVLFEWKTDAAWASLTNVVDQSGANASTTNNDTTTNVVSFGAQRLVSELAIAMVGLGADNGGELVSWDLGFRSPGYSESALTMLMVSSMVTTAVGSPTANPGWTTPRGWVYVLGVFREQNPSLVPPSPRVPRQLMRSR